jgi:hypothetical protein
MFALLQSDNIYLHYCHALLLILRGLNIFNQLIAASVN